ELGAMLHQGLVRLAEGAGRRLSAPIVVAPLAKPRVSIHEREVRTNVVGVSLRMARHHVSLRVYQLDLYDEVLCEHAAGGVDVGRRERGDASELGLAQR